VASWTDARHLRAREPADQSRPQHDERERHPEHEQRQERRNGEGYEDRPTERSDPDPDQRCRDDADDGPRQAFERPRDPGHVPVHGVHPRQRDHQDERGEEEEHPGRQRARRPVQQPPDVDRELVRLGTGQEHREVQRVQEARLVDPSTPVDQLRCA
jgi:hypothetical protein